MLNCGAHQCQQVCHRGQCQPCPRSPSLVKTCPCAQTPLSKLLDLGCPERRSCSDPIPSCGKTCNKPLACGSSGKKEGATCVSDTCCVTVCTPNILHSLSIYQISLCISPRSLFFACIKKTAFCHKPSSVYCEIFRVVKTRQKYYCQFATGDYKGNKA